MQLGSQADAQLHWTKGSPQRRGQDWPPWWLGAGPPPPVSQRCGQDADPWASATGAHGVLQASTDLPTAPNWGVAGRTRIQPGRV